MCSYSRVYTCVHLISYVNNSSASTIDYKTYVVSPILSCQLQYTISIDTLSTSLHFVLVIKSSDTSHPSFTVTHPVLQFIHLWDASLSNTRGICSCIASVETTSTVTLHPRLLGCIPARIADSFPPRPSLPHTLSYTSASHYFYLLRWQHPKLLIHGVQAYTRTLKLNRF